MRRIVGVVVVALMIFGLVPYQLRATAGPIFWVQANNSSSYNGGMSWHDISGFGRTMTIIGSEYYDSMWLGGVMVFDGTTYAQSVLVTGAQNQVSMETWFATADNSLSAQVILYNGSEAAGNGYGLAVNDDSSTLGTLNVLYGGHRWFNTGYVIQPETLYHAVMTIDDTNTLRVYVNGNIVHTGIYPYPNSPSSYTRIGNTDSSAERHLLGYVSVARMYDRVLTGSEVLRFYQGNLSTSTLTATHTSTPSNTPTRTSTPTATATPSNTSTRTSTPTATATPSNTPTFTPTGTSSATSTVTPSDTSTSTVTPTYPATSSATATQTASPSATRVFTPSITPSVTLASAQRTATSMVARTQTAVTGATRTMVTGLTRTAAIRTRTASVARAQTQTAYARTRTAQMGRTLTAIRAKTNTVIARTRTSTRTRTATLRRILIVTMTPTPIVPVER